MNLNFITKALISTVGLSLVLLFSLSTSLHAETDQSTFNIGVAIGLTGPVSSFCQPVKNGILMAHSELSKEMQKQVVLHFEDDEGVPRKTVSAYKKLSSAKDIDALITCASNTSKAVSSLTNSDKIPHIAIASDYEIVKDRNYVVNLWVTPDVEAPIVMQEVKKRGYKKIARITAMHDGTLSFKKIFDEQNKNTVSIELDEDFDTSATDFKSYLAKLKTKNDIDAIFLNLFPGQIGIFAKQARAMGYKQPFFGFELFEDVNEVKNAQGALENQWYVQADEGTSDFLDRYKTKYPKASSFAAANGYDAIALIAEGLKNREAQSQTKEMVNKTLHEISNFTGALGTYSATGDNRFTLPAVIKVVKDGKFIKLG